MPEWLTLYRSGSTCAAIAKRYGTHATGVRQYLKAHGVKLRARGGRHCETFAMQNQVLVNNRRTR